MVLCSILTIILFFCSSQSLKVSLIENGTMATYLSTVKLEGVVFNKRSINTSFPVTLKFKIEEVKSPSSVEMDWLFESEELQVTRHIDENPAKSFNVYSSEIFNKEESTLHVQLHLTQKNFFPGNYTLVARPMKGEISVASGFVYSPPTLPLFTKPKRVLENDIMRLSCHVNGFPKPTAVSWSFSHIPVNQIDDRDALISALHNLSPLSTNKSRLVFDGTAVKHETLRFTDLKMSDNGMYACNVSIGEEGDFTLIIVNVKDRWAAMWPFFGIVIEVTVLVAAILLYERHQMRLKPNVGVKVNVDENPIICQDIPPNGGKIPSLPTDQINETDDHDTTANCPSSQSKGLPKQEQIRQRTGTNK